LTEIEKLKKKIEELDERIAAIEAEQVALLDERSWKPYLTNVENIAMWAGWQTSGPVDWNCIVEQYEIWFGDPICAEEGVFILHGNAVSCLHKLIQDRGLAIKFIDALENETEPEEDGCIDDVCWSVATASLGQRVEALANVIKEVSC